MDVSSLPNTPVVEDGAALVFVLTGVTLDDYLLLIIEPDRKEEGSVSILKVPGGRKEEGETREQTACRELYEETGLNVSSDELVYLQSKIFSGRSGGQFQRNLFAVLVSRETLSPYIGAYVETRDPNRVRHRAIAYKLRDVVGGQLNILPTHLSLVKSLLVQTSSSATA